MDLSFAWTTPALIADRKSCTRRDWSADYAARFRDGLNRDAMLGGYLRQLHCATRSGEHRLPGATDLAFPHSGRVNNATYISREPHAACRILQRCRFLVA
jgi:hypothetical protein